MSTTRTEFRPAVEIAVILHPFVDANNLTLYSIDGNNITMPRDQPIEGDDFHGCPVLGKVDISDPTRRKAIVEALAAGISEIPMEVKACFWPHHAIRAEKNGQTIDCLICFYCSNFRIYSGDTITEGGQITHAPEKLLNQYLTEAGVPIGTIGTK